MVNPYDPPKLEPPPDRSSKSGPPDHRNVLWTLFHPSNLIILIASGVLYALSAPQSAITVCLIVGVGFLGHLTHLQIYPSRLTVLLVCLISTNLGLFFRILTDETLDVSHLVKLPLIIPMHLQWNINTPFALLIMAIVFALMLAHSYQPTLRNALISSMGIGIWYSASMQVFAAGA